MLFTLFFERPAEEEAPMSAENKALVRGTFEEVLNQRNLTTNSSRRPSLTMTRRCLGQKVLQASNAWPRSSIPAFPTSISPSRTWWSESSRIRPAASHTRRFVLCVYLLDQYVTTKSSSVSSDENPNAASTPSQKNVMPSRSPLVNGDGV